MVAELAECDRPAQLGGGADEEGHLGLDVELHGRAEERRGVGGGLALAGGAYHVRAGDDDVPERPW